MTQKELLIDVMRREANSQYFDQVLSIMDSIQQLKSHKKGKTLSYYKEKQIVAALRTHTLPNTGKFVLSVPNGLAKVCPQALTTAREIWGGHPLDNQGNPGNKESSLPMIIDQNTFNLGIHVIDKVFRQFSENGCDGVRG